MTEHTYQQRRGEIEHYFDRTAMDAWARLTSDAPVSRIRATVRAGRTDMRNTLLSWLPEDLTGKRLLDAGCGTGALAMEAARRGADVVAVDLSPQLVQLASERLQEALASCPGSIEFQSGDMLDPAHGQFDYVVAMDSVIHYQPEDVANTLTNLLQRTHEALLFTFAPGTPLLRIMHKAGKLFPKSDRSPSIVPISQHKLQHALKQQMASQSVEGTGGDSPTIEFIRDQLISSGFYKSHAQEISIQRPPATIETAIKTTASAPYPELPARSPVQEAYS